MQSEDFLNLFTFRTMGARSPPSPSQPQSSPPTLDSAQSADIINKINMLLGDSLDLSNINTNMNGTNVNMFPQKDSNFPDCSVQNTFTGTDLISNYPTFSNPINTTLTGGINSCSSDSLGLTSVGPRTSSSASAAASNDLVPGYISNRALEHTTTTPLKPCRAIRGDKSYASTPNDDRRLKMDRAPLFVGNPPYNSSFVGNPPYNSSFVGNPPYVCNTSFIGNPPYVGNNSSFLGNPPYIGNPSFSGNPSYVGNLSFPRTSAAAASRSSLFDDQPPMGLDQSSLAAERPITALDGLGAAPNKIRSSPVTDSDTSGFSSDTSGVSESYLMDLMNSLSVSNASPSNPYNPSSLQSDLLRQQVMGGLIGNNWADGYGNPFRFGETAPHLFSRKVISKPKVTDVSHLFMTDCSDPNSIERAARLYRSAASICEATCTWSGQLPQRVNQREPVYSCKVFLGGIPWDITEAGLERCFKPFGPVRVEWPGKDGKHPRFGSKEIRGYAYLLFESDKCVKTLLDSCSRDVLGGEYYYKVPSKRLPGKKVQIIPWILSDSNYVCQLTDRLDTNKTVFVGALHGMINAEALATIMNDLFGDVVYAGIDLDKHKYPIGSGRITFSNMRSYMKAVCAAFVEVKTLKFTKTIQIDPYLEEDTLCQNCNYQKGRFFCRDQQCFRYYCQSCWQWQHTSDLLSHHKPLMRYKKSNKE